MARTKHTQRKSTGPHGVPRHQLASRHKGSSSGSKDLIGDLEARVEHFGQNYATGIEHVSRIATVLLSCQPK
jgi:hypothetical protein